MSRPLVRAIRIRSTGGPDALRLEQIELRPLGPNDVRVRHRAIGVNYIDTYHRSGLYPKPLPAGLGVEAVGRVEELGPGVEGLRPGDRVGYVGGSGEAYAEQAVVPAAALIRLPDAVSDEVAAAVLLKGLTVHMLFHQVAHPGRGDAVLFHAAAGGVGLLACQWARDLGLELIGTVGSRAKAELALRHGCAHAIRYREEDFVARTRELTGRRGVGIAYDSVGRDTTAGSLDCLAPRGLLVSFGNASGPPPPIELATLAAKGSLYVTRPSLFTYIADAAERDAACRRLFERLERGALRPEIGGRYPLAEAARAHADLEARVTTGSLLLIP